jgi:hypothetical protein
VTRPSTLDASTVGRLRRIRWAVRLALTAGVAASIGANILHAAHNPISQSIAAWPPLALLLTVELVARVPLHTRALAAVRIAATTVIAGIAAWVSYWHMAAVAARYGETPTSAYLLPVSVDGLIVVASISLVELANRINATPATAADHSGRIGLGSGPLVSPPAVVARPITRPGIGQVTR